ncbi:hypothetical protein [Mycobacterium sp. 236(2023)]|uniref:hypothetical protein n=1 Tax=Mycobacterium sp. 236(2023) TaxID=3038163 RepID=UPI0024154FF1|nr:hypothetical protein [Mycobacterium sp. 236(2023)]MDG4664861.1 hypothetical protein [Mycobacterium sp. 236(2023)]
MRLGSPRPSSSKKMGYNVTFGMLYSANSGVWKTLDQNCDWPRTNPTAAPTTAARTHEMASRRIEVTTLSR